MKTGTGSIEEPDQLDLSAGGNAVLGAGYSLDGKALFFSVASGMITIQPSHQPSNDTSKYVFLASFVTISIFKITYVPISTFIFFSASLSTIAFWQTKQLDYRKV